jgi:predicted GIY-YIG superfamily endonuclease
MEAVGHAYKRAVYAIEFSDNSVYVGLTYDYRARFQGHIIKKSSNPLVEKKKKTKRYRWVEFNKWLDLEEAQKEENRIKTKYIKSGWNILNRAKTGKGSGSLGSARIIWTDTKIAECASLCKTPGEFKLKFPSAYRRVIMQKKELIPRIYRHMSQGKKPNGYWLIKENCRNAAAKFKKRSHFKEKYARAYHVSRENGWLKEFFQ